MARFYRPPGRALHRCAASGPCPTSASMLQKPSAAVPRMHARLNGPQCPAATVRPEHAIASTHGLPMGYPPAGCNSRLRMTSQTDQPFRMDAYCVSGLYRREEHRVGRNAAPSRATSNCRPSALPGNARGGRVTVSRRPARGETHLRVEVCAGATPQARDARRRRASYERTRLRASRERSGSEMKWVVAHHESTGGTGAAHVTAWSASGRSARGRCAGPHTGSVSTRTPSIAISTVDGQPGRAQAVSGGSMPAGWRVQR